MMDPVVANDRLRVMDVRRLAAIDMYGTRGTVRRRRIILAEFVLGVLAMVAFGIWLLGRASSAGGYLLGGRAVVDLGSIVAGCFGPPPAGPSLGLG
jgi:hypothetical protein